MIVVDTNVIAYLLIPGENTSDAEELLKKDPFWISTLLWRSEFRNVLLQYMRHKYIDFSMAVQIMTMAEQLMRGKEYEINSTQVLDIALKSNCSAYDCEFVSLAKETGTRLITTDKKVLNQFPDIVSSIQQYLLEIKD
ncbi:MAG: PIN domain-containing protein [Calditrichaeota bacterium]|nr:MAG: PIN domain-containing protein [Calditrichota bacterium]